MGVMNMRANSAQKIGLYRQNGTYFIPTEWDSTNSKYKLLTVKPPEVTGSVPDHVILSLEETCSIKPVYDTLEVFDVSGAMAASKRALKTVEYKSKQLQRDVDTLEFTRIWAGVTGVLIFEGHLFEAPVSAMEYVAIYGQIVPNEAELDSKEGRGEFLFKGLGNAAAISIKITTGDLTPPLLTPAIDITIAKGAMYKRVAATVV